MKKSFKIVLGIAIVLIVCCCIFAIIDRTRTLNDKEPIFCKDISGGSVILYIGPGYIIEGAWDDNPGGLKYTKMHTWIWFFMESIRGM